MSALRSVAGASAMWCLEQAMGNQMTAESHAVMFGPDSAKWPAWWYDAVQIVEAQKALERSERMRQDQLEARNGGN